MAYYPTACSPPPSIDWNDPINVETAHLQFTICVYSSVQELVDESRDRDTYAAYHMYTFYFLISVFIVVSIGLSLRYYVRNQFFKRYSRVVSGTSERPPIWVCGRHSEDAASEMVEV